MIDLTAPLRKLYRKPAKSAHSFTRPANATAYTAGKVMADATSGAAMRTFSNVARVPGGAFRLNKILWADNCANVSGSDNYDFVLWLFDTALGTPPNDGANMDYSYADLQTCVGMVPLLLQTAVFTANITGGENSGASGKRAAFVQNLDDQFQCAAGSTSLYGVLEVLHAWTPVSAEQFTITLIGEQL